MAGDSSLSAVRVVGQLERDLRLIETVEAIGFVHEDDVPRIPSGSRQETHVGPTAPETLQAGHRAVEPHHQTVTRHFDVEAFDMACIGGRAAHRCQGGNGSSGEQRPPGHRHEEERRRTAPGGFPPGVRRVLRERHDAWRRAPPLLDGDDHHVLRLAAGVLRLMLLPAPDERHVALLPVSYTHLTLPTNREV